MDDGSRNVAESVNLLHMLLNQHVDTVVATPHFYANAESKESFLQRRAQCYHELMEKISSEADMPRILLGAEVKYYSGISGMENLRDLCIEGTNILLLEMPFSEWTEYTVRELDKLARSKGIVLMLAHVERYWAFQKPDVWNRLRNDGIILQVNAEFFADFFTRRKALRQLVGGGVHVLGSDCHNITSRAPKLGKAYEIIGKKLGGRIVDQMRGFEKSLLSKHTKK
jgi:protein-tyrosine phosphatase